MKVFILLLEHVFFFFSSPLYIYIYIFSIFDHRTTKFVYVFMSVMFSKFRWRRFFLERRCVDSHTQLFNVTSVCYNEKCGLNGPRAYMGLVMIPLTLYYTTRLKRPGLTSSHLYHYLRLFTVRCLVWTGCGVEFTSPQRSWSLHILKLCTCQMFLELMSCATNVSFHDVSRGFKHMGHVAWFYNIL